MMASKFLTSKERGDKGRAMRRLSARAVDEFMKVVHTFIKPESVMDARKHRVSEHLEPLLFTIAANRESDGVELGMAASLRLCLSGCWQVVCAPYTLVMDFLSQQHGEASPKAVLQFLSKSSASTLTSFSTRHAGALLRFSSQLEAVFLPLAWAYHEHTQSLDVSGICLGLLPAIAEGDGESKNCVETLHRVNTILHGAGKPSASLQAVVDFHACCL